MKRQNGGHVGTQYKNGVEPVTHSDLLADRRITEMLGAAFPQTAILSEGSSTSDHLSADFHSPLWVVDPIDGTANYSCGHPYVSVAIAYSMAARQGRRSCTRRSWGRPSPR